MKSLLCTAALLLGAFILVVEIQQVEAQAPVCGKFELSCSNASYASNGVLSAKCDVSGNNAPVESSIDLNDFIGNINGDLDNGANFTRTCTGIVHVPEYETTFFTIAGSCAKRDGTLNLNARFNVDFSVGNTNGVLTWVNCV